MSMVSDGQQPVNILKILTVRGSDESSRKSEYYLKSNELRKLLEPVMDMEVVVIAVVGQQRRGKSFLLNYMWRFLNDYNNIDGWMGDGKSPLEGFQWMSSLDPQTFGLWLSKPFIVKQSNGKEIAVLLMDTQGLFDDTYDQRDWSTIVGISLLVSSCLIVNVFTDIPEDILQTFDSYIKYGLKAVENNTENNESIPFQTLLFLVRDWNFPDSCEYGTTGGQKYLKNKLIVTNNQSNESKNVRKNIAKCFKDILCFLMPPFGSPMNKPNFNGSYNQFDPTFWEEFKKIIPMLLNTEELVIKTIDSTPITGRQLFQLFESYTEVFNGQQLPKVQDIIEVNALLFDNHKIINLKDKHLNKLRAFIQTKQFLSRNELRAQNDIYKSDIIEDFKSTKKSNNTKIIDELIDYLIKNYDLIYNENEEKRKQFMENKRELYGKEFNDSVMDELKDKGFVDPEKLDKLFKSLEEKVFNSYKQCFGGEDDKLFEEDFSKLKGFICDYKRVTKIGNSQRVDEYIRQINEFYNKLMENLLNDNKYLEDFKGSELRVREKTEINFEKIYDFQNQTENSYIRTKVEQKLNESKTLFEEKNKTNCLKIIGETEEVVNTSIKSYDKDINEWLYSINSLEDFEKRHQSVRNRVIKEMENRLPFKAPFFIAQYFENFNTEINKIYESYRTQLNDRIEKFLIALNESKDYYTKEMNNEIKEKGFLSLKDLNTNHQTFLKTALNLYESHFEKDKETKDPLFKPYQSNLKVFINEEYEEIIRMNEEIQKSEEIVVHTLINDSIITFNKLIDESIETINEEQLTNHYEFLIKEFKTQILKNSTVTNKELLNEKLSQFESHLWRSYSTFREQFNVRMTSTMKDYENKRDVALIQYKQRMVQMLEQRKYVSDEELFDFHETTKSDVISEMSDYLKPLYGIDVNIYIETTEGIINEEYNNYYAKNEEKVNNSFLSILNSSKAYYKNEMESLFGNNEFYSKEKLDKHLSEVKSKTIRHFEKYMSEESFIQIKREHLDQLNEHLDVLSCSYNQKNEENWVSFDSTLKQKIQTFEQKYSNSMNSSVDSILSEEKLNSKHKELMTQLMSEFIESVKLMDEILMKPYQQSLKEYMNSELTHFTDKIKRKVEEIAESYEKYSSHLTSQYTEKMEKIIITENIFSEEYFEEQNTFYSTNSIDLFEKHLKENPCSESKAHSIKFKDKIEEEYQRLTERFNNKMKKIDIDIKQLGDKYANYMNDNIKSVDSVEDLKECHKKVKEMLVRVFKDSHHFFEDKQFIHFIEIIEKMFDNSFIEFESIFKRRLEKLENQSLTLKREIVNYYKNEMNKFFENKEYIPQIILNKHQKLIVGNIIEKYIPEKGDLDEKSLEKLVVDSIENIFKKIVEDNQMNKPTESQAIGIDLGTAFGCVAYYNPGINNSDNVFVIHNESGHTTIPKQKIKINEHDSELYPEQFELYPKQVFELFPEQVSAKVLKKMKGIAENHLYCEVTKAVIKVPAYFNDEKKEAVIEGGRVAGLAVLRINNEPTAVKAAVAFKVNRNDRTDIRNVLMFDFSDETIDIFDIYMLEINRGTINVRIAGEYHLYQNECDNIIDFCLDKFKEENDIKHTFDSDIKEKLNDLRDKIFKILISLVSNIVFIEKFYKNRDLRVVLPRDKLEELKNNILLGSKNLAKNMLNGIQMSLSDINDLLLIGGKFQISSVKKILEDFFGVRLLNHWINSDKAMAKMAAIQATLINNGQQFDGSTQLKLKYVGPKYVRILTYEKSWMYSDPKYISKIKFDIKKENGTLTIEKIRHFLEQENIHTFIHQIVFNSIIGFN